MLCKRINIGSADEKIHKITLTKWRKLNKNCWYPRVCTVNITLCIDIVALDKKHILQGPIQCKSHCLHVGSCPNQLFLAAFFKWRMIRVTAQKKSRHILLAQDYEHEFN